ncbi:MAG: HK97 gp10 family phage protein [Actinomycetota bacterium]|nr:HK97 gp10 family phage protein [Actinomycetota bacterium]
MDTSSFLANLDRETEKMQREAEARLRRTAESVARKARARAPVDTGRLKASIQVRKLDDGTWDVGSYGVEYAPMVEFGTSDTDPRPFMRPAFAEAPGEWTRG